ncbi:COP1-interactive protein 1-like [Nicotiana tomentosiformis]|uniref:COP1-interactive protein 1-like n=1 Tax=Nicotiana tomentosiformis TaxID=4098 RepID=UPI00388C50D7
MANLSVSQLQQKLELIGKLREEVDEIGKIGEFSKCQTRRETLEEIHAWGFNLSEEITKARELEAEAGALDSDDDDNDNDDEDDGSQSGSQSVTSDAALRPSSGEEGNKSLVLKQGKDKKRRASSRSEDPKPKTRKVRRKAIALSMDSVQRLREEDSSLALVIRYTEAIEVARAPEPMVAMPVGVGSEDLSLDRSAPSDLLGAMTMGHSPSLPSFFEEALKEARELKTPDIGAGSSAGDPFRDCFTGVDDGFDIGDASLLLEEAQHFITRAINRFRVDLSQCETELRKVLGERDALQVLFGQKDEAIKDLKADLAKVREEGVELDKQVSLLLLKYGSASTVEVNPSFSQLQQKIEKIGLLREEVNQIRAKCNRWKETIDRLAAKKETISTQLLSADVQLQSVKQNGLVQAKKIDELETRLVEAKAEVESSRTLADKSIAIYRADAEAA